MNLGDVIKGRVEGRAVVKDKDGNIKGSFSFGGEATLDEIAAMKEMPPDAAEPLQTSSENSHGSDPDHGRS